MRIFKVLVILVMVSVAGVAATVAYITQIMDPNDLKPIMVDAAKQEKIDIQFNGNISLNFWPRLSISIEKVSASSSKWKFKADQLTGSLSILSLISDTIIFEQLIATAPRFQVKPQTKKIKKSLPIESVKTSFRPFIIRQLKVLDGEIKELFPELTLSRIQLSINSLNSAASSDLSLSSYVSFRNYQAPIEITAEVTPTATFDGLTVKNVELSSRNLSASYQGYMSTSLAGQYSGEGKLNMFKFSPRQWLRAGNFPVPNTSDLTRFSNLTFETGIKLSNEMISLRPFSLVLDETSIDGRVDILFTPFNIDLELLADQLNLDLYSLENKDKVSQKALRSFWPPGTYKLDIASLRISDSELKPFGTDLGISSDEITIGRLDAGILGGEIRASGTHLIAPQITNLSGTISEVQFAKIQLKKPFHKLAGQVQASFDLRGAGRSIHELLGSLSGPIRLKVKDAFLDSLNISRTLCHDMDAEIKVVPSSFDTLKISADFQEGIAAIKKIESRIGSLMLSGSGRISLLSTAANIQGSIEIPKDGKLGHCEVPDKFRGKKLPLICRGQVRNQTLECSIGN